MKRIFLLLFLSCATLYQAMADEGMWIPMLLENLNQSDMQSMGLKLTAADIYSINKSSLKDAVCLFGGGCTAEVVSDKGMIFTNHHCGYSAIQSHSTLDNDYLTNGFWATDLKDELSNPGLTVTFLVSMEDVTSKTLNGVTVNMTEVQRTVIIQKNIAIIESNATTGTKYKAKVKSFYYGNEYYLFITQVFTDVRLVGTPPNSIGNFGGDSDNWEWPRHTGDFCVFRIYADKNNEPAAYADSNVPYKPKKSLTISLKGVKKGDFTMVYGFPGRTQEYLTSYAVDLIGNKEDPTMVGIRDVKLNLMRAAMNESKLVKLQYSSKYVSVANYWKKWAGESKGLKDGDAVAKKKALEAEFTAWVNADDSRKLKYGGLLKEFEKVYAAYTPVALAYDYYAEAGISNEIIRYAWGYNALIKKCNDKTVNDTIITKFIEQSKTVAKSYFKNFNEALDKKIFIAMMSIYYKDADTLYQPEVFRTVIRDKFKGDIAKYADYIYGKSTLTSLDKVEKMLANFKRSKVKTLAADPEFVLASGIYNNCINHIQPLFNKYNDQLDSLYRIYISGLEEMLLNKKFYPDANLTLRVAYGKVDGYKPKDAVEYLDYTTLAGVMQKEDSEITDYKVPAKLKELYLKKDYGRYSTDSTMHIAFIATNHTTGGNSGSPVLNGNGELIGINFDRVWQGTMSDIMFDPSECRNISLDIRYTLFIIDKYAGAKRLIDEMKIVE